MPYFLAAGNHVNKDIPGEIACARAGAPDVVIEMSQYLGASEESMADLVLACSRIARLTPAVSTSRELMPTISIPRCDIVNRRFAEACPKFGPLMPLYSILAESL